MAKKNLFDCKDEAERREFYPELCKMATAFERCHDPLNALKCVRWIILQRQMEQLHEYRRAQK